MKNTDLDIRQINFGCSDAHTESEDYPELLQKGYVDLSNVVNRALNTSTFLFLGYKGSGKSSLSEHLRLQTDIDVAVDTQRLTNFSFEMFNQIIVNDKENELRAQETWRWILNVKVLQNLMSDDSAHSLDGGKLNKAVKLLTQAGLLPIMDVSQMVSQTSTDKFKATIKAFEFEHESKSENIAVKMAFVADFIKNLISTFCESHKHIIVIDDLDDILHPNGTQYCIISALINEAQELNRYFKKNNLPIKIIVLCRMDIFDRLSDPNKNKIKQDSSYDFIWYREGVDKPNKNPLVSLANRRASMVYPEIKNLFKECFPTRYYGTNIYSALLDFTRHTPRDFIELLNYIKKQCTSNYVKTSDITNGMKEYSTGYFIQEINDELAGYVKTEDSSFVIKCMSALRKRDFYLNELEQLYCINPECTRDKLIETLNVLYECSAIGHIYSFDGGKTERVSFKYRNRNSTFTEKDKILLHKGLWKALNVSY